MRIFHGKIVLGVKRLVPAIDLIRVQDVGLSGATDFEILEWAAREKRILLTHDLETVPSFALARIKAGNRCRE